MSAGLSMPGAPAPHAPAPLRAHIKAQVGALTLDVVLDTAGGTLVIVGPNGAGKTSLLHALLGLLPLTDGWLTVGEVVLVDSARGVEVPLERRRLGYVPQDYALFPHLDVSRNVGFALASAPQPMARAARLQRVQQLLAELGLEHLAARRVQTLSGGEQQRVALARALAVEPRALLLDEPLSALDAHARREVRGFLAGYLAKLGLPTLIVTHDAADARALGGRVVVVEDGRVTQTGPWEELAARPKSPFVTEFVASARGPA